MLSMGEMNELEHSGITDLIGGLDSCFEVNPEPGIDRRPVAELVGGSAVVTGDHLGYRYLRLAKDRAGWGHRGKFGAPVD